MANDNVKQLELNGRLYDYSDEVARASIDELAQSVNPILPLDTEPTANSAKGITSGGVKTALDLRPIIHKESFLFVFNADGTCTQSDWGMTSNKTSSSSDRNLEWWTFVLPTQMQGKVLCFTISDSNRIKNLPYVVGNSNGKSLLFVVNKGTEVGAGPVTVDIVYTD